MNSERKALMSALCDALVIVPLAVLAVAATASLLARAGIPFSAAYTGGMLAAVIGTLVVSWHRRTLIALPSPAIGAWLVYEEIIARGLMWQEVLSIAALVSCLSVPLLYTGCALRTAAAVPPVIRMGLVLGLGLSLLTSAALSARILLPSPWALTMSGTLSDPLAYYTLTAILLALLLHAMRVRCALPLAMGITAILTWAEGFWALPDTPFLVPEPAGMALMLPQADAFPSAAALALTLLLTLVAENAAVLLARTGETAQQQMQKTLPRLFVVSGIAALLGVLPLTIAPLSAVLPASDAEKRIAGIPLTAGISSLFLLILLPCTPLVQEMAAFPAAPSAALALLGLMLLTRALALLRRMKTAPGMREAAVYAAFLLASYDIKTGLTTSLLLWVLLTVARGEHRSIPHGTWILSAVLLLLALLKWIR